MRKFALILGIIWLAGLAAAGMVLLTSGQFESARSLMYSLIGAALPGVLILRWGLGNRKPVRPVPDHLASKAPYDRAAEAGHVLRIGTDLDA